MIRTSYSELDRVLEVFYFISRSNEDILGGIELVI